MERLLGKFVGQGEKASKLADRIKIQKDLSRPE